MSWVGGVAGIVMESKSEGVAPSLVGLQPEFPALHTYFSVELSFHWLAYE